MARSGTAQAKRIDPKAESSRGPEATASIESVPRERILGVARQHFFTLGFARFTMDDLAAELGMSKKTLYRHFRKKDEIIDAVIDAKARDIRAGFDEILARTETAFFERVGQVAHHIHAQLGELSAVFFRDLQRFAPASFERLEAVRSDVLPKVWQRLFTEGIEAGAIRPDIDAGQTAQMVLICIRALVSPDGLERLRLAPHEVAERFFNMIFAGILTPAGQQAYENERPEF